MLDTFASLAPALAAWRAGRLSRRDPVGQMAIAWAAMTGMSIVQLGSFLLRQFAVTRTMGLVSVVLLALLLVPPFLTWIGPPAKRWQPALFALFVLGTGGALLVLGHDRRFNLFIYPALYTPLAILALAMLAAQARRAGDAGAGRAEPGWLWIGGGHLAYFLVSIVGVPLIEAVLPRGLDAATDVHFARLLIYSAMMFVIAAGVWRSRSHASGAASRARVRPMTGPA